MAVVLESYPPVTLVANTATPISSDHVAVTSVTVSAGFSNTGNIYIGGGAGHDNGVTVTTASGEAIPPGDSAIVYAPISRGHGGEEFYLDEVFLITATGGNTARVTAFRRRPG